MTTRPTASPTPTFHVRSGRATARGVVITAIWLTLVVGFLSQVMSGAASRNVRDQQAAAPASAVQHHG